MNRRELLKKIALTTGVAVVGGELFLTGCDDKRKDANQSFNEDDMKFFDEVAETILPSTDTPGAKEAGVGKFIAHYAEGCYTDEQLSILKEGINQLDEEANKKYDSSFEELTTSDRVELLTNLDEEAKKYSAENKVPHYFTLMKQLTLLGFFTSQQGMTQALKYDPVPGGYWGCLDYNGERAWV